MHGKLIVFEGTDSSGKGTQTRLLVTKLKANGKAVETMFFPTHQTTKFGNIISMYLKGEFGTKEEIIPEIGSLLYSIDRYQFKQKIKSWLEEGKIVILDRYTSSNIFQAAKAEGNERFAVWEWSKLVESRLPASDAVVFLNVPPRISETLFAGREVKNKLVGTGEDIHEMDKVYQEKVRQLYLEIARRENWIVIECCRNNELRKPEDIHEEIHRKLRERNVIQSDKY